MLPLPRQPPDRRSPRSPAEEAGKNPALTKMAAATGQGAGLSVVRLSRPFLCFRLFVLTASFRQYLFPFLLLGAPGAREEALSARIGGNTRVGWGGRRDFRVSQEVTRQPRPPTGGTAGGFRCQPGLDPAEGLTLPVSDRASYQGPGPVGRALGSEPTALAWNSPLYLVRIPYLPAP